MKTRLTGLLLLLATVFAAMAPQAMAETRRILVVGNSFSFDATLQEFLPVVESAGDDIVLGFPYKGGTTLAQHWGYISGNQQIYNYYKISGGKMTSTGGSSRCFDESIIGSEPWDAVVIQTDHNYSGTYDHYFPYLDNIIEYIRERLTNKDAQFYLYMTWAYQEGSSKLIELINKGLYKDQADMYAKITECAPWAADKAGIGRENVIPGGTAVQNGRSSYLGDTYNRDGYHMDLSHGRYTLALTWYEKLFGKSAANITYHPSSMTDFCAATCRAAASAAIANPWQVTSLEEEFGINPDAVFRPLDRPVLINFGIATGASAKSEFAWNNFTSHVYGATESDICNSKGYATDLRFAIKGAFEGVSVTGSTKSETALDMPVNASRSAFYGTGSAMVQISGLYTGQSYDLTIFASADDNSTSLYTAAGVNEGSASLNADANTDRTAEIKGIVADENGRMNLTIAAEDQNDRFYLGALMITPRLSIPSKQAVKINFTTDDAAVEGWNSVSSYAAGTAIDALTDAAGTATGISMTVTAPFAGATDAGVTATTTDLDMPAAVSSTGFWVNGVGKDGILVREAEIVFSGLDPDKEYDFCMYGSITGATETHEAEYSTFGASDNFIGLDANDNTSATATLPAVRPDADGRIRFTVTPGATSVDTYKIGYINAMSIMVPGETEVVPFEPTSEGPWDGMSMIAPARDASGAYTIYTGAELAWVANQTNAGKELGTIKICADIDLGNKSWTPIGYGVYFNGSIVGGGHRIYNLLIDKSDLDSSKKFAALVGMTNNSESKISDLYISGRIVVPAKVTVKSIAGSFIGKANALNSISNCHSDVTIDIEGTPGYVGGVLGFMKTAIVKSCSYSGTININNAITNGVGGVLGCTNSALEGVEAEFHGCYFTGTIRNHNSKAKPAYVGGINGYSSVTKGSETITDNYVAGTIDSDGKYKDIIVGRVNTPSFFSDNNFYFGDYGSLTANGGEQADAARFHSGEIAYLLNGDQMEFLFGQDLSNPESMPVVYNGQNRVNRITYKVGEEHHATVYCNAQLILPEVTPENCHWEDADGNVYDGNSVLNNDLELFAKVPTSASLSSAAEGISITARQGTITVISDTAVGELRILAVDGRTVLARSSEANTLTLSTDGLPSGVYIALCGGKTLKFVR